MYYNQLDSRPDLRGYTRAIMCSNIAAILNYFNDPTVPFNNKGKLWQDIVKVSGVILLEILYFKPLGFCTIKAKLIQQTCKDDEGIINAVYEEEKLFTLD